MRLHLILVWFFSFSFAQALFVKRDLVPQENLLGLEEVEKQVDAFVTIVVQLETRPIIDSVQLIAAYLKIHEAIIKSTNLCMKEEGPFTPTQAVTLIERTATLVVKLEQIVDVVVQLKVKLGVFRSVTVFKAIIMKLKVVLENAANCIAHM
jgi:hypothetical protein